MHIHTVCYIVLCVSILFWLHSFTIGVILCCANQYRLHEKFCLTIGYTYLLWMKCFKECIHICMLAGIHVCIISIEIINSALELRYTLTQPGGSIIFTKVGYISQTHYCQ